MMYSDLPKWVKRDLRRVYGRIGRVCGYPRTMDLLLAAVEVSLRTHDAVVLDRHEWKGCSGFGARATICALERRLPVDGHFHRKGQLLIVTRKAA